jgi:hypothetical protein
VPLTFDEVAHRYAIGERELLSVTRVLDEADLVDKIGWSDAVRTRGTFLHAAIVLFHDNDLDVVSLDPILAPYLNAYVKFLAESGFIADAIEEQVWSESLRVAGTLDLRGRFPCDLPAMTNVVDVKTGDVPDHVGYQVAGYAFLLPKYPTCPPIRKRWALNLRGDGTYRLIPLTNPHDEAVFLAALTLAKAKRGWFR